MVIAMGDDGYAGMGQRGLGGVAGGKDAVMQVKAAAFWPMSGGLPGPRNSRHIAHH